MPVRERPIIFSVPMVLALLKRQKTQTRRLVKPQPDARSLKFGRCPYGEPGDRLWVRETWALMRGDDEEIRDWPRHRAIPTQDPGGGWRVWYRAGHIWESGFRSDQGFRWRSPIHMPRWAARLVLEIVSVHTERLSEISENGVRAEGFGSFMEFYDYFLQLNKKRVTDADNPWLWVVRFRVLDAAGEEEANRREDA